MTTKDETALLQNHLDAEEEQRGLTLRPAEIGDIPPLALLLESYRDQYFDDYSSYDHPFFLQMFHQRELLTIDYFGYAVGVVRFYAPKGNLSIYISLLIKPLYLRRVLRQQLLSDILDYGFSRYGAKKIKAEAMHTQKNAIRLLKRCKFKQCGLLRNETTQKGKKVDLLLFELHQSYWERSKA